MGALSMEIENMNRTYISEKSKKRHEQEQKKEYSKKLFDLFYEYFKENETEFSSSYEHFCDIDTREKIIKQICKNENDLVYINQTYNKTLKEVYNIFKINKYTPETEKEKTRELKTLDSALYEFFTEAFDKTNHGGDPLEGLEQFKIACCDIDARQKVVKEVGETVSEREYINSIYDKTFKRFHSEYKKGLQFKKIMYDKTQRDKQKEEQEKKAKKDDVIIISSLAVAILPLIILCVTNHWILAIIYAFVIVPAILAILGGIISTAQKFKDDE